MSQVPEGAQRSEDGFYWWDGSAWQLIPDDERTTAGTDSPNGHSEMTMDELALITTEDQLDERAKPYFEPDADKYPDDDSEAEGTDVLSDEPAHDAAGGA